MTHLPIARAYIAGVALIAACTAIPQPCDTTADRIGQCESRDAKQFTSHPTGPEPAIEPDRLTDYDSWRDWRMDRDAEAGISRDWDEIDRRNGA